MQKIREELQIILKNPLQYEDIFTGITESDEVYTLDSTLENRLQVLAENWNLNGFSSGVQKWLASNFEMIGHDTLFHNILAEVKRLDALQVPAAYQEFLRYQVIAPNVQDFAPDILWLLFGELSPSEENVDFLETLRTSFGEEDWEYLQINDSIASMKNALGG